MAGGSASTDLVNQLDILASIGAAGDLSDAQLLRRYLGGPGADSQPALAALVDRHGPMVLRACRRVLGGSHDAEDAFQATFLLLVRKADSVRNADSVAGWLHGVAIRVALRAKADAARRTIYERRGAVMKATEPGGQGGGPESWPELHEEIARLPRRYREPVVLCYLEGLSAEAASLRIGCPRGTVLSRLSRARERLRVRVACRGLALPAAFLGATTMPEVASAALPAALLDATVRASLQFAGKQASRGASASATALAEGMLNAMMISKLKALGAAAVILGIGALAAGVLVRAAPDPPPREAPLAPGAGAAVTVTTRVDVSADDLIAETGIDIYKLKFDFEKGRRFHVVYRVQGGDDEPARNLVDRPFEATGDGPVTVRVSFLRADRKLQGFLLSAEPEAEYRVTCTGCDQTGFATFVRNPLGDLEPTRRGLGTYSSFPPKEGQGDGVTVLLRVVANHAAQGVDLSGYPRGEVVVTKDQ